MSDRDPVSMRGAGEVESQTQVDTQAPTSPHRVAAELKRRKETREESGGAQSAVRMHKKVKISVGEGVDMEE